MASCVLIAPEQRRPAAVRLPPGWALLCAAALCGVGSPSAARAGEMSFGVRIEWGGGAERVWTGSIHVSAGQLTAPRTLGVEADEAGSMWLDAGALQIHSRSGRTYDGVDITVTAREQERLEIQLTPLGQTPAAAVRIPLLELQGEFRNIPLDDAGNRLLVRRTPGDKLRVSLQDKSLIYLPGDVLRLEVQPYWLPLEPDSKVRLSVQLLEARGGSSRWQTDQTFRAGDAAAIPLRVPLPDKEGVYDVLISAAPSGWQHAVRNPLGVKPVAERRVQALVLDPRRPPPPAGPAPELARVGDELDPAAVRRTDERAVRLPGLGFGKNRRGPTGSASHQLRSHALGALGQLPPSRSETDPAWESFGLSIQRPGLPHVLEVDYPSDVPQTLGVSIVEANAAGVVGETVESALEVTAAPAGGEPPQWRRHRIVFWPRTKSPVALLTNRSAVRPAVYGKIRTLGGWDRLPPAAGLAAGEVQRTWGAYFDRPLLAQNFAASDVLDPWLGRGLDDWVTFYEAGSRLVDYLRHVGYDGLLLTALADGSAIYPSAATAPTPRYDTGVYADSAQDPLRKDVLEMLFRLFDREQLRLTPGLEFAAPLPQLEALRRRGAAEGLDCVGAQGLPWTQVYSPRRGLAVHYNPLDPRVQEAMLAVVREAAVGYAQHSSFAGLAIKLCGEGYAQLPGADWCLDDATIARFQQDTQIVVPGAGPQRHTERARFLAAEPVRRTWLQWRAEQLHRFYQRVHAEVVAVRPGCRVYLAGAELYASPTLQDELRPTLPRKTTLAEVFLKLGLDVRRYQDDCGVVLLRSEQSGSLGSQTAQAVQLEVQQLPDADRLFQDAVVPGSLFFHPPLRNTLPSFDEKGPFKLCALEQLTQSTPSAEENRRRFVRSLAVQDSQALFDGGWCLARGQEDALGDLLRAYRRLPAARFEALSEPKGAPAAQPVTVRWRRGEEFTWVYLVNDAPFPVAAVLRLTCPADCRVEELTGRRSLGSIASDDDGQFLALDLQACDLLAFRLTSPQAKLLRASVRSNATIEADLAQRIRRLGEQAAQLASPQPLPALRNAGFEEPAAKDGRIPGWALAPPEGASIRSEDRERREGAYSLCFRSAGSPARLASEPFPAPQTGRISISAWLRVGDAGQQPPLLLAIEGQWAGRNYYRYAPLGRAPAGSPEAPPLAANWGNYIFQVDDLPLDGLSQLRVRFDLTGAGEVWIDDVQVHHLYFSKKERVELSKLIALADVKLQQRQLGDCVRLLDGYWPRFLARHLSVAAAPAEENAGELAEGKRGPAGKPSGHSDRSGLLERLRNSPSKWRL